MTAVPGNSELNVKELARMAGERKMELVPLKDVQPLTGYIRGGVTALACKREYPVFLDESASRFEVISISAGIRGTQILLSPDDFVALTHAQLAAISAEKG